MAAGYVNKRSFPNMLDRTTDTPDVLTTYIIPTLFLKKLTKMLKNSPCCIVKERDLKKILDLPQNLMGSSLGHGLSLHHVWSKSVHYFFINPPEKKTNKRTQVKTFPLPEKTICDSVRQKDKKNQSKTIHT